MRSFVKYCSYHSKIKINIFGPPCNIFFIWSDGDECCFLFRITSLPAFWFMNSSSVCIAATAVDMPGSSTMHFLKNPTAAVNTKQMNTEKHKLIWLQTIVEFQTADLRCPSCFSLFYTYTAEQLGSIRVWSTLPQKRRRDAWAAKFVCDVNY